MLRINKFFIRPFPPIAIRTSKVGKYREAHGYINTVAFNCCEYSMRRCMVLAVLSLTVHYNVLFYVQNKCTHLLFTLNKRHLKFTEFDLSVF